MKHLSPEIEFILLQFVEHKFQNFICFSEIHVVTAQLVWAALSRFENVKNVCIKTRSSTIGIRFSRSNSFRSLWTARKITISRQIIWATLFAHSGGFRVPHSNARILSRNTNKASTNCNVMTWDKPRFYWQGRMCIFRIKIQSLFPFILIIIFHEDRSNDHVNFWIRLPNRFTVKVIAWRQLKQLVYASEPETMNDLKERIRQGVKRMKKIEGLMTKAMESFHHVFQIEYFWIWSRGHDLCISRLSLLIKHFY